MVGHEIVGVAIRVGSQAPGGIKVGDLVGVGAQSGACASPASCPDCSAGRDSYCPGFVDTFNGTHLDGSASAGGYALYHRCPSRFVIPLPPGLAPELAAPMLCGGITVYAPLKHWRAGPGKKVAVIGLGGLGHMAVLFARALGADEVVGISRRRAKRAEALELGCTEYIATAEDEGWERSWERRFDLIISTASGSGMPFRDYVRLLATDGTLVQVGAPEENLEFNVFDLLHARRSISSSKVGSPEDIRDMFELAAEKGVKPWVEVRPMSEANQAIVDLEEGKPRFRYVLKN